MGWVTKAINALLGWIQKFFVWIRDELVTIFNNVVAWFVEKYNDFQDAILDKVLDVVSWVLDLLPELESGATSDYISDIRDEIAAWNLLVPISETFTILTFFVAWELVRLVVSIIRFLLSFVFGSK